MFSVWQPLLNMSNKAIKLNFSQYIMQTFWKKIMQLTDSILSEIFSADVIALWQGYTVALRAADTRSPGLSWKMRPIAFRVVGSSVQPGFTVEPLLAPALPEPRSRVQLYSAGFKDLALRDKSLSCLKARRERWCRSASRLSDLQKCYLLQRFLMVLK